MANQIEYNQVRAVKKINSKKKYCLTENDTSKNNTL